MPYEAPIVVAVNGALVIGSWTLLPQRILHLLFTLHGSLALPLAMAAWMYADVPATNVLGSDAARTLAALDDPAMMRRLLFAKRAVLWMIATPVCVVAAVFVGLRAHALVSTLLVIAAVVLLPPGALPAAGWFGMRWPYHAIPLRERWEHREPTRRMLWRWLVVVCAPYVWVPAIIAVIAAPAYLAWVTTHGRPGAKVSDAAFAVGVAVSTIVAMFTYVLGAKVGVRILASRRDALEDYLSHPELG